jgi:biopolymer transport protein ExbD
MTWKIRHEGSPKPVEGLSLEEVLHGLADGNWQATDEVMGPNDRTWIKLEDHPQFAELAGELEPPPPRTYGDEDAHVDMNALIDVCMVLLIFFILTTSYAALQSRLESPDVAAKDDDDQKVPVRMVDDKEQEQMIRVVVTMDDKQPVIRIEGNKVKPGDVEEELKKLVRNSKKTTLLLEVDPKVPVKVSMPIQRDAQSAGMKDIKRVNKG